MKLHHNKIQTTCMAGLLTAIIAITAQFSILLPFGVPFTLQTLAITLAGIVLGARIGALSAGLYLLIGAVGLPVFANFTGGLQTLFGPTSGFLLSFPLMAYIIGWGTEHPGQKKIGFLLALILGTTLNLLCGSWGFVIFTGSTFPFALTACVLPFLPATLLKGILGAMLGLRIRKSLQAFR